MIPNDLRKIKFFNNKRWLLLFYQNIYTINDFIKEESEFLYVNQRTKFSIFKFINEDFKYDNFYEFLLEYPSLEGYNQWKQGLFPLDCNESEGDKTVDFQADSSTLSWSYLFKGLISSSAVSDTFLDGSVDNDKWWYSIGAKRAYTKQLFPGPATKGESGISLSTVYLWIYIPPKLFQMFFYSTCNIKIQIFNIINNALLTFFIFK